MDQQMMFWVRIVADAVVLGLLIFAMFHAVSWMKEENVISKMADYIIDRNENAAKERERIQELLLRTEGKQEKTSLADRFDTLVRRSGIKTKIPFMSSGLYGMITVFSAVIVGMAAYGFTHDILKTVIAGAAVIIVLFLVLSTMATNNYKKTEAQLLHFCDTMANFSTSTDDLMTILERTHPYVDEPIKSAIETCYLSARATGDIDDALQDLIRTVGHDEFSAIIQNLAICSRYTSDFAVVIKDCRSMLDEYTSAKKMRRAMVQNARIEMALIIALCCLVTYMVSGFTETGIMELLLSSPIGWCMIAFIAAILLIAAKVLFGTDKGRGV